MIRYQSDESFACLCFAPCNLPHAPTFTLALLELGAVLFLKATAKQKMLEMTEPRLSELSWFSGCVRTRLP